MIVPHVSKTSAADSHLSPPFAAKVSSRLDEMSYPYSGLCAFSNRSAIAEPNNPRPINPIDLAFSESIVYQNTITTLESKPIWKLSFRDEVLGQVSRQRRLPR